MANSNFIVQNGLQVGPLVIDAATGSITTSGNVSITGNLGVSQISKNDSSIGINDTGAGSNVSIIVDGTQEMVVNGGGATITNGDLTLNAQGDLRFADSDSSNWVAFQAPATVAANVTWTLPAADGTANQALVTNGSGTLSWSAAGATITDDTTTNATRYIMFDDATTGYATSVLVSSSKLTYNPSTGVVGATGLTATGTVTAATVNAATIGNTGALLTGTLQTASQTNITGLGNITTGTWNATTISTTRGGTGLTSFTSGGALYATSTSALTTGTLPVASGGTGTTTSTGTGSVVLSTSPSLTTPVLGAATGTSLNLSGALTASGTATVNAL